MTYLQDPGFERFVAQRRRKLQRIAYKTRGEHQFSDLVGEAWLIGQELMARNDVVPDFLDPSFQDLLLSHLYQHFIRYEEKTFATPYAWIRRSKALGKTTNPIP